MIKIILLFQDMRHLSLGTEIVQWKHWEKCHLEKK